MNDATLALLALGPGMALGYVGHELAHYGVLKAAGRDACLSLWPPRVGFSTSVPIPAEVRLAAVAPALLGVAVIAVSLKWWADPLVFGTVVGAVVRLFKLSPADRRLALGRYQVAEEQ